MLILPTDPIVKVAMQLFPTNTQGTQFELHTDEEYWPTDPRKLLLPTEDSVTTPIFGSNLQAHTILPNANSVSNNSASLIYESSASSSKNFQVQILTSQLLPSISDSELSSSATCITRQLPNHTPHRGAATSTVVLDDTATGIAMGSKQDSLTECHTLSVNKPSAPATIGSPLYTALVTSTGKLYIGEYDGEHRGRLNEVCAFPSLMLIIRNYHTTGFLNYNVKRK